MRMTPRELADTLTMAGLEVKGWEEKQGDTVFEAEITSNRPDWLSLMGIAREVAAISDRAIKQPKDWGTGKKPAPSCRSSAAAQFSIDLEDQSDCPLYTARIITGVRVGPSPEWLRQRLEAIGCRSVNNVVDITNYVLYELGEPLHAFDLATLGGNIIRVRRARAGETIATIDGVQRQLSGDILVIADENRPVAVAGIMGGKDTEVIERTTDILLEAALFNPVVVRRGRQKLGMQSEAAYRFERGVDADTALAASQRAAAMIREICGGTPASVKIAGHARGKPRSISLQVNAVNRMLGIGLSAAKIKTILVALGFTVKTKTAGVLAVTVPPFRQDAQGEIDLIEEVARIYGYARIPTSLPKVTLQSAGVDPAARIAGIKQVLVSLGLDEVITYSLIDRRTLAAEGFSDESLIALQNPLNQEQEVLRPILLPSLVRCVAHNLRQQQFPIAIFEIAKGFSLTGASVPAESYRLGVALCGGRQWLAEKEYSCVQDDPGFLHLKGIVEVLFERLGIAAAEYAFTQQDDYRCALTVRGEPVGALRRLDKASLERNDIKNREVFALELSLASLLRQRSSGKAFKPFARFPGILRDISLVVKNDIPVQAILDVVRDSAGSLLQKAAVVDFYRGPHIPPGHKNFTVSCFYCSPERTLSEEEVGQAHARVTAALQQQCAAGLR